MTRCECKGSVRIENTDINIEEYHPTKERPYIYHEPNECKCTNKLKKYKKKGYLCSCCVMPWDEEEE